jgi:hypothetical protein
MGADDWTEDGAVSAEGPRKVCLRSEHDGSDHRYLDAWLDDAGNVHIDGQDLGPATAMVSDDGEYEWHRTIAARHRPRLVELLGGDPDEDLLDKLERHWSGPRSYDLEALLRANTETIPSQLFTWP